MRDRKFFYLNKLNILNTPNIYTEYISCIVSFHNFKWRIYESSCGKQVVAEKGDKVAERRSRWKPDKRAFSEFQKCHQCQRGRQCCTRCVYLYAAVREIGRSSRKRSRGSHECSIEFLLRKKFQFRCKACFQDATRQHTACDNRIPHRSEILSG